MKLALKRIAPVTLALIVGCTTQTNTNDTAPSAQAAQPHFIDQEINTLAKQLIDETRNLANIRQAKLDATSPPLAPRGTLPPKGAIFSGLDKVVTFQCEGCDVKVVLQGVAALLNWNIDDVYEYGRKPSHGTLVSARLNNEPVVNILQQLDADIGHLASIRIDPNFKTILIKYKPLATAKK
ncbi:DotD/TraH family lipoprotein [Vibrio vulnificus]|nr:DotD/TraH family lipoprotein [Vibrio vulnificus]